MAKFFIFKLIIPPYSWCTSKSVKHWKSKFRRKATGASSMHCPARDTCGIVKYKLSTVILGSPCLYQSLRISRQIYFTGSKLSRGNRAMMEGTQEGWAGKWELHTQEQGPAQDSMYPPSIAELVKRRNHVFSNNTNETVCSQQLS